MILFWKNLILFNAGWLACVYGAAHDLAWLGTAVVLAIALEHLRTAPGRRKEAILLAVAAGIGLMWESVMVGTGCLPPPRGIRCRRPQAARQSVGLAVISNGARL